MKALLERVRCAIETIQKRGMVLIVDDESRENEGDVVFAAEDATGDLVNFMARYARGLICLSLHPDIVDRLQLPLMVDAGKNRSRLGTAFTVSIEAREGVTTGISAADRAHTILTAIRDGALPEDLVVPGHMFPLRAAAGGVLVRAGHTEASVDLAFLAGKKPAAVICEVMKDDGTMARLPDLKLFAQKFEIPLLSVGDIIYYCQNQSTSRLSEKS